MIFFLFLCCSNTEAIPLPQKRHEEPLISHQIQFGKLKGHLLKRGKNSLQGIIVISSNENDCRSIQVEEGQTILVIADEKDKKAAQDYLESQVDGPITTSDSKSFCGPNK